MLAVATAAEAEEVAAVVEVAAAAVDAASRSEASQSLHLAASLCRCSHW